MKELIALVLSQLAAGIIGCWLSTEYGEHWWGRGAYLPIHVLASVAWLWAARREHRKKAARFQAETARVGEYLLKQAELSDPDAYRRDVVAVAYGEMDEGDFERKWGGHVPPSPRPPRRKEKLDPKVELFKELMTQDIKAELERPSDGKETWTCKVTLGIHEDGPCQCIELASHPAPLYRIDEYVRWRGDLWRVVDIVKCFGPKDSFWWGYYIDRDGHTLHPFEQELLPATPLPGEWWAYDQECNTHHHAWDEPRCRPFQITSEDSSAYMDDYVNCGCLVPVNFGRGR